MANQYHKIYAQTSTSNQTTAELLATLFEKAARYMDQAHDAITRDDSETRTTFSLKAAKILASLADAMTPQDAASKEALQALKEYYAITQELITQMNVKNDPKACISIRDGFLDLAASWQEMGRAERSTPPQQTTPPSSKAPSIQVTC